MRRFLSALFVSSLLFAGQAMAEDAWTTRVVDGVRWPGSSVVSVKLDAGTRVGVMVREGELVRIRSEMEYGWVPADALTDKDPTGAEPAPAEPAPAEPPAAPPSRP